MALLTWSRPEELETFLAGKGTGFIFKHSTRCSISSEAEKAFQEFLRDHPRAPVYRILVIESRPVSGAVAEKLAVPHASPQAILVRDGIQVWSRTHWDITGPALGEAWSGTGQGPHLIRWMI